MESEPSGDVLQCCSRTSKPLEVVMSDTVISDSDICKHFLDQELASTLNLPLGSPVHGPCKKVLSGTDNIDKSLPSPHKEVGTLNVGGGTDTCEGLPPPQREVEAGNVGEGLTPQKEVEAGSVDNSTEVSPYKVVEAVRVSLVNGDSIGNSEEGLSPPQKEVTSSQGEAPQKEVIKSTSSQIGVPQKEVVKSASSQIEAAGPLSEIDFATRRSMLRFKCDKCGRECPSKHKLKRHLSTHSDARPFPCKLCGRTFKWSEYLQKHLRQQHPHGKKGIICKAVKCFGTGEVGCM